MTVMQDIVTRYATTTGHYVPRKFGWDCHGLPGTTPPGWGGSKVCQFALGHESQEEESKGQESGVSTGPQ